MHQLLKRVRRRRLATLAISASLAALVAGGCGGGDPEDEARKTVQQFMTALAEGDAETQCESVSAAFSESFFEDGGCKETLSKGDQDREDWGDATIDRVTVLDEGRVDVEVTQGDGDSGTWEVAKTEDGWKISGAHE